MERINVVGTSGSGKSTFSKKLAQKMNCKHIEMDKIFWGPNWYWPPDEEFFPKVEKALVADTWVLDGNYTRTAHLKWKEGVTVVWIDLPFRTTLKQAIKRAVGRAITKEELWPETGNIETFRQMFSKKSIIWWTIKSYKGVKGKYESYMVDPEYSHLEFIRLRSHKQMEQFLKDL